MQRQQRGRCNAEDQMDPTRCGAPTIVTKVVKAIAGRHQQSHHGYEERAVHAIAPCLSGAFEVRGDENAEGDEKGYCRRTVQFQPPRLPGAKPFGDRRIPFRQPADHATKITR